MTKKKSKMIGSVPADNTLSDCEEMECVLMALGETLRSMAGDAETVLDLVDSGDWDVMLGSRRYVINIGVERIPYDVSVQ